MSDRVHFRHHRNEGVKEHYDVYLGDWMIGETWKADGGWRYFGQGLKNVTAPSRREAGQLLAERAMKRAAPKK